ncbi:MAG: transketolase [Syntrophomonadaceae bacterium]|nr:transketolase [Syntrophomonadaceae bacterium]
MNEVSLYKVKEKSRIIRQEIIKMLGVSGSGHTGGSLSAADIVACLYFWEMKYDPDNPQWEDRDRFILSKGHAAPLLYAVLAEAGFFASEYLATLRQLGSPLQGHPDMRKLPGVEASTGSLGQGISWAVGMALGAKMDKRDCRIYTLLGDGEIQEGMVWEAAMAAAHYRLDNLLAIIDNNGLQIDGRTEDIMCTQPIDKKFSAFGWNVLCIDGHDHLQIMKSLDKAREFKGKPTVIVARTIKGKGCSFMEDRAEWHGIAPNLEETEKALAELTRQM